MIGRSIVLVCLGSALLAASGVAEGALIRLVDDDGVVIYTDNPWQFDTFRRQQGGGSISAASAAPTGNTRTEDPPSRDVPAAARSAKVESAAEEVFRLSGLGAQVEILSALAQDDFERLPGQSWRTDAMRDNVAAIFSADRLRVEILAGLRRRLEPDRTRSVLAWLRSPLARRIVRLESLPPSPDRAAEEAAYVNQLPATPPPAARLALIHRVERATEATETTAVVMSATIAALRRAVIPLSGGSVPGSVAELEAMDLGANELLRFRTVTAFLFIYRELSDADLARYAAFLESPTGRWFTSITRMAILESIRPPEKPRTAAR